MRKYKINYVIYYSANNINISSEHSITTLAMSASDAINNFYSDDNKSSNIHFHPLNDPHYNLWSNLNFPLLKIYIKEISNI